MSKKTSYNISIPTETYRNLQKIAEQDGTTIAEIFRKAVRWFLFVRTIKMDSTSKLLIEQDGELRELVIDLL